VTPGSVVVEGKGTACLVPVPALPSPQQRELSQTLRGHLELHFANPTASNPAGAAVDPVAFLDEARKAGGHERIGLLGTSVWGLLATAYARRFPENTAFVVLVGTPPHASGLEDAQRMHWEAEATPELKALLEERLTELEESGCEETVATNARAWAPMGWFDPDFDPSDLLDGIEIDHERTDATVRAFASISLPAVVPQLECPVLRVHGVHDYIVPAALWEPHQALGDHVQVRLFEKSGHHPYHEEAERFDAELLAWLEAL
jgi:pimeloyl-ACP methyl ester carboxylesterase